MKLAVEKRTLELGHLEQRESEHLNSKKEWENEMTNLKSEIQAMKQQMKVVETGRHSGNKVFIRSPLFCRA